VDELRCVGAAKLGTLNGKGPGEGACGRLRKGGPGLERNGKWEGGGDVTETAPKEVEGKKKGIQPSKSDGLGNEMENTWQLRSE